MNQTVLIVDDDDAMRRLLMRWLQQWGYHAKEAVSASDALEQMTISPAAIVLTDLMMPVHDGIWLTEQVRARWPNTAVIVASGVGDLATVQALRQHGAVDYVMKPLGRELVRQALDRVQSRWRAEPGAAPREAADTIPTSAIAEPANRAMTLLDRRDTPLGIALVVGTVMIFHRPLQFLFDIAADLESQYHLDLIPALTVFGVVFGFHQYRKYQEARFAKAAAVGEARRANERAEELERLVDFGRDLANAVTLDMIRPVLWKYLPSLGATRDFWILVHAAGRWEALLRDASAVDELETIAEQAMASDLLRTGQVEGISLNGYVCYPMVVANQPVGVLGLPAIGLASSTARRRMGAAAALIAIALKNAQLFQQSQDKGTRDSLTGCFNRGYAIEAIEAELRRAKRTLSPLSVLMFDVDHFKTINDRYGHLAGDQVLMELAQQMQRTLRASDIKCRYGGDEFVVILPDTDFAGGAQVAENLRQAVNRAMVIVNNERLAVTLSIGVATETSGGLDASALLAKADQLLYQAKQAGRNQILAPTHPTSEDVRRE